MTWLLIIWPILMLAGWYPVLWLFSRVGGWHDLARCYRFADKRPEQRHRFVSGSRLGIQVRTGRRLYLGPRVERILNHAPCPVMVVNVP